MCVIALRIYIILSCVALNSGKPYGALIRGIVGKRGWCCNLGRSNVSDLKLARVTHPAFSSYNLPTTMTPVESSD